MGTADPGSETSLPPPVPSGDVPVSPPSPDAAASTFSPPRFLMASAMGAGLAAGLLAWALEERGLFEFKAAIGHYNMMGTDIKDVTPETRYAALLKTAILTFGTLGAMLGTALGFAGGRARQGLPAGALGLIAGGACGAASAGVLVLIHHRTVSLTDTAELLAALLIHGGIFASIGAGAGAALGFGAGGRGRLLRGLIGGAAGGLLGALIYEIVGAVGFPSDETSEPIAGTTVTRLIAFVLVSLGSAVGAALSAQGASAKLRTRERKA